MMITLFTFWRTDPMRLEQKRGDHIGSIAIIQVNYGLYQDSRSMCGG